MQTVESYLYPSTMNVEVIDSSEMLVTSYHTTWHHIPKDSNLSQLKIYLFVQFMHYAIELWF